MKLPKKVLVLGSGALQIGQAGEFDYSGSQALKALKEEGIKTILINPNIATIQTSEGMADKVYFLPVTPYFVEKVIIKEKPDGILLSFGGQTALNCGVELHEKGILKKYNIRVLGTPVEAIMDTEDRDRFVKRLNEIGAKAPVSEAVASTKAALKAATKIGYPVMIRIAYALGGLGSGPCYSESELVERCEKAFSYASQVLVEEYLHGWKEVEYEVVRDCRDNCITVCNMENLDPMGIHTGESIVVAPSQTLSNREYHKLREIAIRVIRHIGVVGECNIQYALDPNSEDYRIIEVNARLSRSSALASKATGYPLAFVAAKLGLGYALPDIKNSITKSTSACFEPALDYIVVKIPRWDLKKFAKVSRKIGSSMMSVGEVMAIGRKFEEALQKALRMLEIGVGGLVGNAMEFENIDDELANPTDLRIFALSKALKTGYSIDHIHDLTKVDKWFLQKIENIVKTEKKLKKSDKKTVTRELLLKAKTRGFSDSQIGYCLGCEAKEVKELRKKMKVFSYVKQIDTLAAEYPAKTNYLYLTYNGTENDVEFKHRKKVLVLGSGTYRIGSSVEFDWCCVNAVKTLKKLGYETIMLNYNPETVSTDYDECDRLYFDEISIEAVMDIYDKEKPLGVIVSMGGQVPNNLVVKLQRAGARVLGTTAESIDRAENRFKFSKMLDELGIDQPRWEELTNPKEAIKFANEVGYPVLVRPSYVLSGAAMSVAGDDESLVGFLTKAAEISKEYPVVISKFIERAKEIEIDAVAKDGKVMLYAISEHVENAGVHSGDATMVLPPQSLYLETIRRIKATTHAIAKALNITGPFNIQFMAKENNIMVIECNLRASRSFPFVSKVTKTNFIDAAVRLMLGMSIKQNGSFLELDYVGVKSPQFSFTRLKGADPILSVEMASTGEVGCLGKDLNEAFLKSILSTGIRMPEKCVLLSISGDQNRFRLLDSVKKLEEMGFDLYATEHTSEFMAEHGIKTKLVYKARCTDKKNVIDLLDERKIDFMINIPNQWERDQVSDGYKIRRKAVDYAIPLINDVQVAKLFIESIAIYCLDDLEIKSWDEYG